MSVAIISFHLILNLQHVQFLFLFCLCFLCFLVLFHRPESTDKKSWIIISSSADIKTATAKAILMHYWFCTSACFSPASGQIWSTRGSGTEDVQQLLAVERKERMPGCFRVKYFEPWRKWRTFKQGFCEVGFCCCCYFFVCLVQLSGSMNERAWKGDKQEEHRKGEDVAVTGQLKLCRWSGSRASEIRSIFLFQFKDTVISIS